MITKRLILTLYVLGLGLAPLPAMAAGTTGVETAETAEQTVKGSVTDGSEPLIGAFVKVAGTSNGAVTDIDGNFTLRCRPGDELEVSSR